MLISAGSNTAGIADDARSVSMNVAVSLTGVNRTPLVELSSKWLDVRFVGPIARAAARLRAEPGTPASAPASRTNMPAHPSVTSVAVQNSGLLNVTTALLRTK